MTSMVHIADVPMACMPFPLLVQLTTCNRELGAAAKRELLLRDRGVDMYHYFGSMTEGERYAAFAKMEPKDAFLVLAVMMRRLGLLPTEAFYMPLAMPVTLFLHATTREDDLPWDEYDSTCTLCFTDVVVSLFAGRVNGILGTTMKDVIQTMVQRMDDKAKEFRAFLLKSQGGAGTVLWHTTQVSLYRVDPKAHKVCLVNYIDPHPFHEEEERLHEVTMPVLAMQDILTTLFRIGV